MHTGPITSIVVSKDGKKVYTGGYDSKVYVWDRETDKATLIGTHDHLINSLALSKNGYLLATASSDYTIKLFNLETNTYLTTLLGHLDDVSDIAFTQNDTLLVSASYDKRCLVWDIKTGRILTEFHGHNDYVTAIWPFDKYVVSVSNDGIGLIWDVTNGELLKEIDTYNCDVDTVDGSENKSLFAIGADNGTVSVYSTKNLELVYSFQAHDQGVKKVLFSNSGDYLLTAGYDHSIKIWSSSDGKLIRELEVYKYQWERSFAWMPDEKSILGSSFGKRYCEWDFESGKLKNPQLELATPSINELAVSEDFKIATASDDGKFRINGEVIGIKEGVLTNSVGISNDGHFVIWGDHAGYIHIVDTLKNHKIDSVKLNTGPVNSIFYNKSDKLFYIGSYGGFVHVVDPVKAEVKLSWKAHSSAIKSLAADSDYVITGSTSGSAYVFDKRGNKIDEFIGPTYLINDIHLNSKDKQITLVSRDKHVRIMDLNSGRILAQHNAHRYSIKSVTRNENGVIVSGDYWGFIVIWDLSKNTISKPIRIASNGISSLFTVNNVIFASSYDGGIYKIDIDNQTAKEVLRLFNQK